MLIRTIFSLLLSSLLSTPLNPNNPSPPFDHRRILRGHHKPSPPLITTPIPSTTSIPPLLPPTQPPSPSFPKYPSSSLPTPTTDPSTTTTPFTTFPFFPSLPSPPPPPTPSSASSQPVTFPANISSVLPTAPHSASPSRNIIPTILLPLLSVSLFALLLSLLLVHLRRRRNRTASTKDSRSDSVRLFPPPPPSTSNPSTEFLYLGTLVNPRGTSAPLDPTTSAGAGDGGVVVSGSPASPELHPLPPLPRNIGCSHGMMDAFEGSAPSSVTDPASTSVSSSLPTSSSLTRFSRSSKESETWGGASRDAELRPPPIPPAPATMLRRPNQNQNQNLNLQMQRNEQPKLKPLFWDKVPSSSNRVMAWDHLKSGSFQLNEEMMQSLFGNKSAANVPSNKFNVKNGVCSTDEENLLIIDQKKSQNIAILLKALNLSKEQVCVALLEGNGASIGSEVLEALIKMSPTKEEERKLKEHRDDSPSKLGPAEAFIKAVIEIPFAFKRVDAMLFMVNFDHEVSYVKGSFRILEGACDELKNSKLFHKVLDAVLKTGNRINSGTYRGEAKAFKLDALLKLADIKSNDGKTTLLHFIIQEVIKSEKIAPQFISSLEFELTSVKKASTIDLGEIASTVSKLSRGIEKVCDVIQLNQPFMQNERGFQFHDKMRMFLQRAEVEISEIQDQENVALSSVRDTAEFFHGDSVREENEPFRIFVVVRDFLALLDNKICKEAGKMNEGVIRNYEFQMAVNADGIPSLI